MAQIQKEEADGELYQMSMYGTGYLPGSSPRQRQERKNFTSEAKKKINANQRRWRLMQLVNANFSGGRDLFVCLTYREIPVSEGKCLSRFHSKIKKALARWGIDHAYVAITESHDMEDEPVRVHHHLIMRGARGAGMATKLRQAIQECWTHGNADIRILREYADFFEDTVTYLLKEDKPERTRHYNTSRNLKPPCEPIRLRLPEDECGEVPPGVTIVSHEIKANEFGRYEYLVGRIYDHKAFDAYWEKQRKRAAPDPWERLRRRKYRTP